MYNLKAILSPLTIGCLLATCVSSLPTNGGDSALSKRATVEQNVFFDINSTEAEKKIAQLKAEAYRPTSLSVHGSPTDAKYAGIWTKEDGNAYETILGADENTYNAWLDSGIAKGLVSTHVSATGSASNAVFAGVMQQFSPIVSWVQRCGLDNPNAYLNATGDMQMLIKGVSMYGVPGQRRYCILGHENTVNSQQTVWYQTDSNMNDYKTLLASETSKKYWRPVYIEISGDHVLSPIFDDTTVGQWTSLTDLTTSQLESEVAAQREKNMHPIHLSSGGDTEAKYVVIFAERTTPLSREWHATGSVTGFTDNAGATDGLDQVMQGFMKRNSVRQAQVAASVDGKVVASRSYTWAENDRAVVQPKDKFLLASVSKIFTFAATTHLVDAGLLNLTTKVYPLLGYNNPADERSLDITVQQLMEHTAGFDRSKSGDIGFIFTDVAKSLNQATPVTLHQMIEYIVARPLDFTPGTQQVYSNYGTMLLSYVVANLTGETYMSYLEKNVLEGADVDLWATAAEFHKNDAIVQESKSTGISALTPLSPTRVSATEGGDGAVKEEAIGSFALRASAETISQFIGKHNPLGYGGRVPYAFKDGSLAGARSMAYSMTDLDFAIILNTSEYGDQAEWNNLVFNDIQSVWYRYKLAK
jgi:CubicO group peptidase (beta-lactamase class C family)